jgi:DNA-binding MarR family transcriptional regulator
MTSTALEPKTTAHPWSFVTSHALALIELARNPDITIRALATRLELTERHTHRVVTDLVEAGYVARTRIGRRNRYEIDSSRQLRTPSLARHEVGDLLQLLAA